VVSWDRLIVGGALALLTALCWSSLTGGLSGAQHHAAHAHSASQPYTIALATWIVMMVGMMAPSALPFLTTYATMARRRRLGLSPWILTAMFFLGYCLVWVVFSAAAAAGQVVLHRASLLSAVSGSLAPVAGGSTLVAAGLFQWTPLKAACLRQCRSPLAFLFAEWRDGPIGACRMGLHHGLFCLGCCWLIMLLPFAAGVMNMTWMVGITVFILVEKVLPGGEIVARVGGTLLTLYGVFVIWNGIH
jgi:predicted metal-binding membrane protein